MGQLRLLLNTTAPDARGRSAPGADCAGTGRPSAEGARRMLERNRPASPHRFRPSAPLLAATLLSFVLLSVVPDVVFATSFAAKASVTPSAQYLGDSAGTVFNVAVRNTGSSYGIAAVRIKRPFS